VEEAPENGKESSHSAHANGMNKYVKECTSQNIGIWCKLMSHIVPFKKSLH